MQIIPNYRFQVEPHIKSNVSSIQEQDKEELTIEDSMDGVIDLKNKDLFIEDTDSMAAEWVKDIQPNDVDPSYDPFFEFIDQVNEITYYDVVNEGNSVSHLKHKSLHHLSLMEAIIYHDLLNSRLIPPFNARLSVSNRFPLNLSLTFHPQRPPFPIKRRLNLTISKPNECLKIFEDNFLVGSFNYVFRDQKLEEIVGVYRDEKILLDPVWTKNATISFERIHLGNIQGHLVKKQGYKKGLWTPTQGSSIPIEVIRIKSKKHGPSWFSTFKDISLGDIKIMTFLLYHKQAVMPLSGFMHVCIFDRRKSIRFTRP